MIINESRNYKKLNKLRHRLNKNGEIQIIVEKTKNKILKSSVIIKTVVISLERKSFP